MQCGDSIILMQIEKSTFIELDTTGINEIPRSLNLIELNNINRSGSMGKTMLPGFLRVTKNQPFLRITAVLSPFDKMSLSSYSASS